MSERIPQGRSGGVNSSRSAGCVGGDIVGPEKIIGISSAAALDGALRPVLDATRAAPPQVKPEAEAKRAALRQEAGRSGKRSEPL